MGEPVPSLGLVTVTVTVKLDPDFTELGAEIDTVGVDPIENEI
ncbi:MAG: hypothetical protein ACKOOE_07125 [Micrococcales bacterium]